MRDNDNKPETLQLRGDAENIARVRNMEIEAAMSALYALNGGAAPVLEERFAERLRDVAKPSGVVQPEIDLERTRQDIANAAPGIDTVNHQRMAGSNGMSQELTNA